MPKRLFKKGGVLTKHGQKMVYAAVQAKPVKTKPRPPSRESQIRAISAFRAEIERVNPKLKDRITPAEIRLLFSPKRAPVEVVLKIARKIPANMQEQIHKDFYLTLGVRPNFENLIQSFMIFSFDKYAKIKKK